MSREFYYHNRFLSFALFELFQLFAVLYVIWIDFSSVRFLPSASTRDGWPAGW